MDVDLFEEPIATVRDIGCIPIAFRVESVFDMERLDVGGSAGPDFVERPVEDPWIKDYDAIEGEGPASWSERFDVSHWGLITARSEGGLVGSAVIAYHSPGVDLLEGRKDVAVLWDIRVLPELRRRGVGAALFTRTEAWAASKGCRILKVETQNINVGACRFYARQGCSLKAVNRHAYREFPNEAQLLWYKRLDPILSKQPG